MSARRDPWDITNRPHTKAKLCLLQDYFSRWLAIWNAPKQRAWSSNTWYVVDLLAGKGSYTDDGETVSGSPLVYLECIEHHAGRLLDNNISIRTLLVEKSAANHAALQQTVQTFLAAHPNTASVVDICILRDDCNGNGVWDWIGGQRLHGTKSPMFLFVDPYGFAIKRETMDRLMDVDAAKDILFNYMVSGVKRAQGIAAKDDDELTRRERTTMQTYDDFLGKDVCLDEEADSPQEYARAVFTSRGFTVAAYDMDYPGRVGTLYYLLLATKNTNIAGMARKMFGEAKQQKYDGQLSMFGTDELTAHISMFEPEVRT